MKSNTSTYNVCNQRKKFVTVNGLHVFWYDEYINMTQEEIDKRINHKPTRNRKAVICLNTMKVYESINYAGKETGINKESIRMCCNHKQNNVCLKDGTKQQWMFYDEYLKLNK